VAFLAEMRKKRVFTPFWLKRGFWGPAEGWFYINPSRRGPVPVPGPVCWRLGAPARRVSRTGVDAAERGPLGSRRDGLVKGKHIYTSDVKNNTKEVKLY